MDGAWAGRFRWHLLYGSDVNFINCLLWGDADAQGSEIYLGRYIDTWGTEHPSKMHVKYSDVGGWYANIYVDADCTPNWGLGNIDADPCFVRYGYWGPNLPPLPPSPPPTPPFSAYTDDVPQYIWIEGNYHLQADSPCIDAGDPNYTPKPNEKDLDGKPRIFDGDNDGVSVVDMGAYEYGIAAIQAEAEIDPHTLNLTSKGRWITCYIWLPEDYNVADIDPNSVVLEFFNNEFESQRFWFSEDAQIAVAKFDREQVQAILSIGEVELTIIGRLTDGTVLEGTDVVKVIDKGSRTAK